MEKTWGVAHLENACGVSNCMNSAGNRYPTGDPPSSNSTSVDRSGAAGVDDRQRRRGADRRRYAADHRRRSMHRDKVAGNIGLRRNRLRRRVRVFDQERQFTISFRAI